MSTRETQIRSRLFGDAMPYDTARAGFSPLPNFLRRCQTLFTPRGWQIYCWVLMKTGPGGVAWFSLEDLAYDLNFRSLPKLKPHLQKLLDDGWLLHERSRGRDYYLVPDPLRVIEEMRDRGDLVDRERIEHIDELLELLRRPGTEGEQPAAASG